MTPVVCISMLARHRLSPAAVDVTIFKTCNPTLKFFFFLSILRLGQQIFTLEKIFHTVVFCVRVGPHTEFFSPRIRHGFQPCYIERV